MIEPQANQDAARALELRELLTNANHAYYVLDSPVINDAIYDKLYRELIELEKTNPELIYRVCFFVSICPGYLLELLFSFSNIYSQKKLIQPKFL